MSGPEGFTVSILLKLHTADGEQVLSDLVDDSMAIPITPDRMAPSIRPTSSVTTKPVPGSYLEARSCTLEIKGDSLGTCELRFDHDPSPPPLGLGVSEASRRSSISSTTAASTTPIPMPSSLAWSAR